MARILKFPLALKPGEIQHINIPGAPVLWGCVPVIQGRTIAIWALVDEDVPETRYLAELVFTGHESKLANMSNKHFDQIKWLGTVEHATLIWHVLIQPDSAPPAEEQAPLEAVGG